MSNIDHLQSILDTIGYVNQFRRSTFLIKIGGSILENNILLESICSDLTLLCKIGIQMVIVHGGSHAINDCLSINNIESDFVDGLRVTSPEAMKQIEMVLSGCVNNSLVRKLNSLGVNSVGLSGVDNRMLLCDYYSDKHGCVGTINAVNIDTINVLLKNNGSGALVPIIAPVGVDISGNPMNINADYAACHIARALGVDKLIYLTDQDGIYDEDGHTLSVVTGEKLLELIKVGTVKGGMLTKSKAIFSALSSQLRDVHILNGKRRHILIKELFTVKGVGTLCQYDEACADHLGSVL